MEGSRPYATSYAGHQFGSYNPQLGDGRALMLGEHDAPDGTRYEIQLKGSGRTAYSRVFDGRAVLRSTIREFLASEYMHAINVPTTRALCMLASDDPVYRETPETAAVLVRVAPTLLRFGSLELHAHRGMPHLVQQLADYVIDQYFADLRAGEADTPSIYTRFYAEVARRTAKMIAGWQAAGFVHGVMNTDNMSLLGLTLDYGPYAFMEQYDPTFCPNHSDEEGRYAYHRQPLIAKWNLRALAAALDPLVTEADFAPVLERFDQWYNEEYRSLMRAKLGLSAASEESDRLILGLLKLMRSHGADYHRVFRWLTDLPLPLSAAADSSALRSLERAMAGPAPAGSVAATEGWVWSEWLSAFEAEVLSDRPADGQAAAVWEAERRARMRRANPVYVPRTEVLQIAITAAQNRDYQPLQQLFAALRSPFEDLGDEYRWIAEHTPTGAAIELSCSS